MGPKFGAMVNNIQGSTMVVNWMYGFVSYLLLGIGTTYFGTNRVDKNNALYSSIINGGLFGLVTYGIFDFTNLAIFKDYELVTAILDTLWGAFLCASTSYISHKILLRLE
jgi:uncharacterized membrane protein